MLAACARPWSRVAAPEWIRWRRHECPAAILIYTAQRAGGAIMAVYTDFSVRDKAHASLVTAADEAAKRSSWPIWR